MDLEQGTGREVSSDPEQGTGAFVGDAANPERRVLSLDDGSTLQEAVLFRRPHRVRQILTTNQSSFLNLFNSCLVMNNRNRVLTKMDDDGLCAIHVAAKLGYCDIIDEFLELVPECVYIRSKHYKTALHVAIEQDQLWVVQKLLAKRESGQEGRKMVSYDHDLDGNTAFHIAAINKVQPQIVKELLRWPGVNPNAMNWEGLTPLDIALHSAITEAFPNNARSVRIKEILEKVGGSTSMQLQDKESKSMEVDTLVASLIATITFAAIFQVPGGIEEDKRAIQHGAAKLALDPCFQWFLFCDIAAFFTSLTVVFVWLFRQRQQIGSSVYRCRLRIGKRLQYLSACILEISLICAGLACVFAVILVVIPPDVKNMKTTHKKEFGEYKDLLTIVAASLAVPCFISFASLCCFYIYDIIRWRLTNPSFRYYYRELGLFIFCSAFLSEIVCIVVTVLVKRKRHLG